MFPIFFPNFLSKNIPDMFYIHSDIQVFSLELWHHLLSE